MARLLAALLALAYASRAGAAKFNKTAGPSQFSRTAQSSVRATVLCVLSTAVPPLSHALLGPPLTHSRVSHLRQGTLFDLIYLYGALPELTAYSWGSLLLISASALSAPRLPGRPLQ